MTSTPTAARRATVDQVCADAVDVARLGLLAATSDDLIGEHVGVEADDERVVTHRFACLDPAYRGWHWAVTVTRASRSRTVTVDETVLLPGPDALLPPAWLPWSERLRPGDLGVGDLLPTREDDARLEPGWNAADLSEPVDDADPDEQAWAQTVVALGLTRPRVLSPIGLADALDRWYSGDAGPEAPLAQAAPASCASCAFLLPIGGHVGQAFGVCANVYSPSDGRVVSLEHGCGAHSEAAVVPSAHVPPPPVVDNLGYDVVTVGRDAGEPVVVDEDPGLG